MQRPQVICVGSALWDIIARAQQSMSPGHDSPGQIERRAGGVALNVAHALYQHGKRPIVLSAMGHDTEGETLVKEMISGGIDCRYITRVNDPTDCYLAIERPDGEVFAAIADCFSLERAGRDILTPLSDGRLASQDNPYSGIAVVDGNLPEHVLTEAAHGPLLEAAQVYFIPASPGKAERMKTVVSAGRGTLFVNRIEAEILTGESYADSRAAASALIEHCDGAVVTDGPKDATLARNGSILSVTPPSVEVTGVTGAGDAFLAGFVAAEMDGEHQASCLIRAADAAAAHISGAQR